MMTFERSMEAHEIERTKWLVLLAPQLTEKVQQAYAALSSEDLKNFVKVREAIFKCYDINEETYRQKFWSAKVREGESPSEVVTRLSDMAAKWLKEHDTRERVIDMIVMQQFLTMFPEDTVPLNYNFTFPCITTRVITREIQCIPLRVCVDHVS